MFRVLLTRRWLGALLAATVFAVLCYNLGWWQWHRHESKVARRDRIEAHYTAPPVDLPPELREGTPFPTAREWLHVRVTGTYDGEQLLVRNRPRSGVTGYEIVAPLTLADGRHLLIDRGWIGGTREGAGRLPDADPPPTSTVTVTGWLRKGEVSLHRDPSPGTLASINVSEAARAFGQTLLPAYVILDRETGPGGQVLPRPTALEPPDVDLGPNQAYAYQWWLFMAGGYLLVWLGVRRDLRGASGAATTTRRPKKVRIWDEEDE